MRGITSKAVNAGREPPDTCLSSMWTRTRGRHGVLSRSYRHRNPYDFYPDDGAPNVEKGVFGMDEFSKQQSKLPRSEKNEHDEETIEKIKGSALRMLSRRSHSKRELKKKLEERGYDHAPVEHVLTRLEQVGLQSDQEFALVFARGKWRQSQWGPGKIRKELHRRGIAQEYIQAALEQVFQDGKISIRHYLEEEAPNESIELWSPEDTRPESALIRAARRQYQLYGPQISKHSKRRRLSGWLQRRGFSFDDISRIISTIERENNV